MDYEVKWIKLDAAFYSNKKIKQITSLPNGMEYALIWIYIMCLAGCINDDGKLTLTEEIPYTDEMLANEFGVDLPVVRCALEVFVKFGMIEIIDNIYCLTSWSKWQDADRLASIREYNRVKQQEHRQRKRNIENESQCKIAEKSEENFIDSDVNDMSLTSQLLCQHKIENKNKKKNKIKTNKEDKDIDKDIKKESNKERDASPFDIFWEAYPKKKSKAQAVKAFEKAIEKTDIDTILKAIELQKHTKEWHEDNGQYIPYPSTWLNQERWEDDVELEIQTNGRINRQGTFTDLQGKIGTTLV